MSWTITEQNMGVPGVDDVGDVAAVPLGTSVRAVHPTYGAAALVYLSGAASTAAGDVVTYINNATTRLAATDAAGFVAVAMAAVGSNQYGWYAVAGVVPVNTAGAVALGAPAYAAAAGKVDDAVVAGEQIAGMRFAATTGAAGQAAAQLAYPSIA